MNRWSRSKKVKRLNVSGNCFNYHSDKVISHLKELTKLVDDLLIQAPTWEEFMKRFTAFMEAARAHGVYISKRKIQFGRRVEYAGYIVSRETVIRLNKKLLKDIREFCLPKYQKDIKKFPGVLEQILPFNLD